MKDEIELAFAAIRGQPLARAGRDADVAWFAFGALRPVAGGDEGRVQGEWMLHVACPWRLLHADRILVGSGDLFTPADAEEDPETFAWDEPGASWLDVRLGELFDPRATPPNIEAVGADDAGGVRFGLTGGILLELFPNASPSGHVTTEFWRFHRTDGASAHLVAGTFGLAREEA